MSLWLAIIGFSLLGATALYSCVPNIEEELSAGAYAVAGAEAAPAGWASIQVDGQRLVLTGAPPDTRRAEVLVSKLAAIDGVIEVDDQLSKPVEISPRATNLDNETPAVEAAKEQPDAAAGMAAGKPKDSQDLPEEYTTSTAGTGQATALAVQEVTQVATTAESKELPPQQDPIIEAAEAGPGRPLLSEPLARCQRDIDAMLTGSASFFTSASSEITAEALPIVDQVAALLAQCSARAEIAGHTDNSGRTRPNLRLSQARADAIRAHLIVKGVPQTQLSAIGFGEERPIVSNRTPEGRRQNRRIEVRIVDGLVTTHRAAPTGNRS